MTKDGGLDALRNDLTDCFPRLLGVALDQYRAFAETEPPEDAKGFAAHQSACKAALAHVEALLKLRRGVVAPTPRSEPVSECPDLIAEAEAYLANLDEREDDGETV